MFTSQFHAIITLGKFPSKTAIYLTNTFKATSMDEVGRYLLPSALWRRAHSEEAHQRLSNFYLTTHEGTQKANGDTLDLLLFAWVVYIVDLTLAETMGGPVVSHYSLGLRSQKAPADSCLLVSAYVRHVLFILLGMSFACLNYSKMAGAVRLR